MRIGIVTNLFPNPIQPRKAAFCRQQFTALARRHSVWVVAPVPWTDEASSWARSWGTAKLSQRQRSRQEGEATIEHPRYWFLPKLGIGQRGQGFCFERSCASSFQALLETHGADAILGCWMYPDSWAAVRLARQAGLPAAAMARGSDLHQLHRFPGRLPGTLRTLTTADRVLTVSQDLADRAATLGADRDRIRVIPNGVDKTLFRPGDQAEARHRLGFGSDLTERWILFAGNLVAIKNVDVLLQACAELNGKRSDWRLMIVGDGPTRGFLQQSAAKLRVETRVQFLGSRPHAELADLHRGSDILALPSRDEGQPNVLLEATASGIPWVASRTGGIPDLVRGPFHRLADPQRPDQIAEAIIQSFDAQERRNFCLDLEVSAKMVPSWDQSARILADSLEDMIRSRSSSSVPDSRLHAETPL